MTTLVEQVADTYRDFVVNGVPSSGPNEPDNAHLRLLFTNMAIAIGAEQQCMASYATVADLPLTPVPSAGTQARVYNDPTASKNGVWIYIGGWSFDTDYYNAIATAAKPAIDAAVAAAGQKDGNNARIGAAALANLSTGTDNAAFGFAALNVATTAKDSVAVGSLSLAANATGQSNTAVGKRALALYLGNEATAVGNQALRQATGAQNTAIGASAGGSISTGIANTVIGYGAAGGIVTPTDVSDCVVIGAGAEPNRSHQIVLGTTTTEEIRAFGRQFCLYDHGTGGTDRENFFIGPDAGNRDALFSGFAGGNMGIGVQCLTKNVDGTRNLAIGYRALAVATETQGTVAIGYRSMQSALTPTDSVAVGAQTLSAMTTGTGAVAIGFRSQENNPVAGNNTAIGDSSLWSLENDLDGIGSGNTAMGYIVAEYLKTGSRNCFMGRAAGWSVTEGDDNVIIGEVALGAIDPSGGHPGQPVDPGYSLRVDRSVIVGRGAMREGGGSECVAVGQGTLVATTGPGHTAIGLSAGSVVVDGSNSIFLGWNAGASVDQKVDPVNQIVIGNDIAAARDNEIVIGDENHTHVTIAGVEFTIPQLEALLALVSLP